MRFMAWHVDYFKAFPTEHGRSSLVEEAKPVECGEALLLFISFEKGDVEKKVEIIDKAVNEIQTIASQLKVNTLILNPFAHLFADLAKPGDAVAMLNELSKRLEDRKFSVCRLSFGMFYEIELKAKGHRLARISRIIS
ncbi:MAG: threonyl-tRNA synthetase editing domain-containing protein [Candidatus Micrarchaeota archaeon]